MLIRLAADSDAAAVFRWMWQIDERILAPALFSAAEENIYQEEISQARHKKKTNEIESVTAPGVLHIKAYKSIKFPLHPIVFAWLHFNSNAY